MRRPRWRRTTRWCSRPAGSSSTASAWVPSEGLVGYGFDARWAEIHAGARAALRAGHPRPRAKPRPVPSRVTVNGVVVDDPAAYAALFDPLPPAQCPGPGVPSATIRIAGVPEPWVDAARPIQYFPASNWSSGALRVAKGRRKSWRRSSRTTARGGDRAVELPWPDGHRARGPARARAAAVGWRTIVRRRQALRGV